MKRLILPVSIMIILCLSLAACSSPSSNEQGTSSPSSGVSSTDESEGSSDSSSSTELDHVIFRLDWTRFASHAPFFYGKRLGFFEEEGIDLEIGEGAGSSSTAQTAGNGQDMFGLADASTVISLIAKGLNAKIVANFFATSGDGIIYLKETGWNTFQDIVGGTIAITPQGSAAVLFPAMLAAGGVQEHQIKVLNMAGDAKAAAVMEGDADGFFSLGLLWTPVFEDNGFPADVFTPDAVGLHIPGHMIIANNDLLEEDPDLARRFLRAYVKSIEATQQNPEAAAEVIVEESEVLEMNIALPQVMETVKLFESASMEGNRLGWIPESDMEQLQNMLLEYGDLSAPLPVETYFTNDFLPE